MMLIRIAVAIICAALTLPLPYVFFGKRLLKTRPFFTEEEIATLKMRWNVINEPFPMILVFIMMLGLMIYIHGEYQDGRQTLYTYCGLPLAAVVCMQFIWAFLFLKKFRHIVIPVLAIAFFLCLSPSIRDAALPYQELTYLPISAENDEATNRIDDSIIQERYKTTMVNYQGHKDETDFYLIDGKDIGFGVLTVDRIYSKYDSSEGPAADGLWIDGLDGYSIIEAVSFQFYPCNYKNTIKGPVRDQFKSEEIVSLGLIIDGETPYGKFGILKRDGFFSRPQVECYVFLNMVTGEVKPAINESTTISI